MDAAKLARLAQDYKMTFGGGMIPFDNAYLTATKDGRTVVEAQRLGAHALIDAFVQFVEARS